MDDYAVFFPDPFGPLGCRRQNRLLRSGTGKSLGEFPRDFLHTTSHMNREGAR